MKPWGVFDARNNPHISRLISALERNSINVNFFTYGEKQDLIDYEIILVAEIDSIPDWLLNTRSKLIGVSWAYDLDRSYSNSFLINRTTEVLRRLDLLVVDCEFYARLATRMGIDLAKIFIMPYGVELETHGFWEKTGENRKRMAIFTNRKWESSYGIELVLGAAEFSVDRKLEIDWFFAGDGSLKTKLKLDFMDYFDSKDFCDLGYLSSKLTNFWLKRADLFVSASKKDGISVSMLESMAVGTPVLVSNIEPNLELIKQRHNGLLFESENLKDLCSKIECAYAYWNDHKFSNISKQARNTVENYCDYNKNVKILVSTILES